MKLVLSPLFTVIVFSGCVTPLSGEITDSKGQSIEAKHGKVNIIHLGSNGEHSFISKIVNGKFEIKKDLRPGQYMIETLVPGYETKSTKIQYPDTKKIRLSVKRLGPSQIQNIDIHETQISPAASGTVTLTPPKY